MCIAENLQREVIFRLALFARSTPVTVGFAQIVRCDERR